MNVKLTGIIHAFIPILCLATLQAAQPVHVEQFLDLDTNATWSLTKGDVAVENHADEGVSIVEVKDSPHASALTINTEKSDAPLRLTQKQGIFNLEPGQDYELTVTLRAPSVELGRDGVFRIFATDTRWHWQTPSISITADHQEWETLSVRFRTPDEMEDSRCRFRIEIRGADIQAEIAEISMNQIGNDPTEKADKAGASPGANQVLTAESVEKNSLVLNGTFQPTSQGKPKDWTYYPYDTSLIELSETSEKQHAVQMMPGAAVLGIHSSLIPVRPDTAYSLALKLKQDEIHIGFDMGGQIQLRWFEKKGGPAQAQVLEKFDGSFDWRPLSYSIVSPPGAKFVQITLVKSGSPGKAAFRDVAFAEGTLKRSKEALTAGDFWSDYLAFSFMSRRIELFLADKHRLDIPGLSTSTQAIFAEVEQSQNAILADAKARGLDLTEAKKSEVRWTEMLKGNQGFKVRPDSPYYAAWKAVSDKADQFRTATMEWQKSNNAARLRDEMTRQFGQFSGYAIGTDSPMLKVLRDLPYTGAIAGEAKMALTRNEEESVQITLSALDRDLDGISLELSPLLDEQGESIPEAAASVSRIDFVKTNSPQYYSEQVGWWPDIVFPSPKADKVSQGTNQSFWVTVATDSATKPGIYRGNILIKSNGTILQTLPLQVQVWDITLPKPGKFKVIGRFSPNQFEEFYGWKTPREDVLADWNRYVFKKRWNTTDPFASALTPNGEALKAALTEGVNAVNLVNVSQLLEQDRESRTYRWPDAQHEEKVVNRVTQQKEQFQSMAGKSDTTLYVFGFDEQHDPGQYPLMKHVFDLAKKAAPEVRTITTTTYSPLKELIGSVDTWVPLLGLETPELAQRHAAGDELFFYIYAHPFHPFPNASLIDYPGIDGRITFWLASERGYTGFLHWLMNGWTANSESKARWPDVAWLPYSRKNFEKRNGEGYFLYPGPDGKPISSVRFELIRDGIEDWELIDLLKTAVTHASKASPDSPALKLGQDALASARSLVPKLDSYSLDTDSLMKAREQVAEALLALNKDATATPDQNP